MSEYLPLLIAAVSGLMSVVTAALVIRASKKKVAADATETLTEIALSLVTPLKEQVDELKKDLEGMEDEITKLKAENAVLHKWSQLLFSQVVESGGEPISFEQVRKLVKE